MKREGNKKVAVIGTRGYPSFYGGFETALRELVPYLAASGWDVTVYGRRGVAPGRLSPSIRSVITPGIDSKSLSTLTHGFTAALHACVNKPDVVLIMNVANGFWLPMFRAIGVKTVVNVDGIEWERAKWSGLGKAVFRLGAWMTAKFASEIVVDAQAIGGYWRKKYGRDGVFIPYGGKLVSSHTPPLGLTAGNYVLAVARLVPENSIGPFLDAAREIAREHRVILVGSSGTGGELEERAAMLSDVLENFDWLGHVRDDSLLHALWSNAGVYFHGHTVGGTNPALVQAMAAGAPTVAVDTVYNREVLAQHGWFVAPTGTVIADQVRLVMADADARKRVSEEARQRAVSEYSWGGVCERYDRLLQDVLESRSR